MADKYTEEQVNEIKDKILSALENVIDPELGIDIINLGLVYEISFEDNGFTEIKMTLTTMRIASGKIAPFKPIVSRSIFNP